MKNFANLDPFTVVLQSIRPPLFWRSCPLFFPQENEGTDKISGTIKNWRVRIDLKTTVIFGTFFILVYWGKIIYFRLMQSCNAFMEFFVSWLMSIWFIANAVPISSRNFIHDSRFSDWIALSSFIFSAKRITAVSASGPLVLSLISWKNSSRRIWFLVSQMYIKILYPLFVTWLLMKTSPP